jgi:hypothetical protein
VAFTDSRWVTDDVLSGAPFDTPITVTQDVVAFGVDANDPDLYGPWTAYDGGDYYGSPDRGYRTAFLRAAPSRPTLLAIETADSDYPVSLTVYEIDPASGYAIVSETPVGYDTPQGRHTDVTNPGCYPYADTGEGWRMLGLNQKGETEVPGSAVQVAGFDAQVQLQTYVMFSWYDPGEAKEVTFRIRRDGVGGEILWTGGHSGTTPDEQYNGIDHTLSGWVADNAPTTGRYVLTVELVTGTDATIVVVGSGQVRAYAYYTLPAKGYLGVTLEAGKSYLIEAAQQADDAVNTALSLTITPYRPRAASAGLLRLGVGAPQAWRLRSTFDLGGPGLCLSEHPFDVLYPLVSSYLISPFDLIGLVGKQSEHPFDLGEKAAWYSEHPFDLIADAPVPQIGILPTPLPLLPGQTPGPAPAFIPGIAVYDKKGIYLGSVTLWEQIASRSTAIGESGSLSFGVPIRRANGASNDAELALIALDRIVVVGNNLGTPPWGGTISSREWGDGRLNVSCDDLTALLSGAEIGWSGGSVDPTPYTGVLDSYDAAIRARQIVVLTGDSVIPTVRQVMAQVNKWRHDAGEVEWEVLASGANYFFGDENISGDAVSTLGLLTDRSFSEYTTAVRVMVGKMVPILVWCDEFTAPEGAALHDGPGGNVGEGILYREASSTIINAMRITGSVTRIESKIPDGAQALPVQERIPVAEVWLSPGAYRRRTNLGQSAGYKMTVNVPYSFPADEQKRLADEERAKMMALFEKYIAAVHDQLGQPYHNEGFNASGGWSWAGPTESIPETTADYPDGYPTFGERYLTVADWVHHRYLASGPSSVVMEKKDKSQRLRVTFDLVTGEANVLRNSAAAVEDPTIVYPFERRYFKNWDPRSSGVGEEIEVTTVVAGSVVKGKRWRIVSWNQTDQNWATQLLTDRRGLYADPTDTVAYVVSILGAPVPPFEATIGGDEKVLVQSTGYGSTFNVVRGYGGTLPVIHEPGESFEYTAPATDTPAPTTADTLPPVYVRWPQGVAFATRLLAKISRPERIVSIPVVNRDGEWGTIALGSTHDIDVTTEGPTGGIHIVGTGRVIGYAPDETRGLMEVIVKVDAP